MIEKVEGTMKGGVIYALGSTVRTFPIAYRGFKGAAVGVRSHRYSIHLYWHTRRGTTLGQEGWGKGEAARSDSGAEGEGWEDWVPWSVFRP